MKVQIKNDNFGLEVIARCPDCHRSLFIAYIPTAIPNAQHRAEEIAKDVETKPNCGCNCQKVKVARAR